MTMATVTNINVKALVGLLLVGSAALYTLRFYYARPEEGAKTVMNQDAKPADDVAVVGKEKSSQSEVDVIEFDKLTAPWKMTAFENIPKVVQDRASAAKATIQEKTVSVTIDDKTDEVFYRENLPAIGAESKTTPLLLLHGMAFTSQNWVSIDTMALVSAMGYRVVAIDLPGYGKTTTSNTASNKAKFLEAFTKALNLNLPIIVSPSMSGGFALPYILQEGSPCSSRVSGYIPVAPVSYDKFTEDQYKACEVPVLIVYGSKDKRMGEGSLPHLSKFPKNGVARIEDAGHPAYIEKPEIWSFYLYNFLSQVAK